MISDSDSYLVEKLREILLGIFQTNTNVSPLPVSVERPISPDPGAVKVQELVVNGTENFLLRVPNQDVVDGDTKEAILRKNLNEFIQVLKSSLNSGDPASTSIGIAGKISPQLPPGTMLDLGSDLNFNMSADDIADLNSLMLDETQSSIIPIKHIIIIVSYFIIACVALIGNLLVVQLVIRSRRLHTLTHCLLANLAISDLFMAVLNIPFSAARVILTEWPFGEFLCHVVPFAQVTSVYVTSITMAVIALDRYQVIMNPLGRRMKSSEGIPLVMAIWTLSALHSLPYALHHKVVTILTVRVVRRCQAEFSSIESRQWLTVGTFLAQYLIPLLLTTISYVSIMRRLGDRSSALGSTTPRQVEAQSKAKRKTIKMLVLTVIFFALSWAPINTYHLLTHFGLVRHNSSAILVSHIIAMSSSCWNPFIYCWLNEHFRREALKWIRCFRTRRSPLVHPGIEVNGMLTRADLVGRRNNLCSTLVHTISFRSQLLPQNILTPITPTPVAGGSSRSPRGFRTELLFLTEAAEYQENPDVDLEQETTGLGYEPEPPPEIVTPCGSESIKNLPGPGHASIVASCCSAEDFGEPV